MKTDHIEYAGNFDLTDDYLKTVHNLTDHMMTIWDLTDYHL